MWSLLILKMKGNFFNQNEFFGIFFGSFYDFFVFYIVDFFTECFLRVKVKVLSLQKRTNDRKKDFICWQIFIEIV